jgi:TonB family protein
VGNSQQRLTTAYELDSEDQAARRILAAVRAILFPVVQADGGPLPTVHLVRIVKDPDGKVLAARSLGVEAVAIAGELAPGEFPLPATANPSAPSGPVAGVNTASKDISKPRISENNTPPRYSEEARKAWLAGTVLLRCVVGSDGIARNFKVIESLGLGLDESAIRAVGAWRFAPAVKDGKPVDVASTVQVNFQISGADSKLSRWHLARARFGSVPGAARPTVAVAIAPRVSGSGDKATAIVTFDIDEQGAAVSLQIDKTSDKGWASDVMAALRHWKFTPAMHDGAPLRVSCTMDFARGN